MNETLCTRFVLFHNPLGKSSNPIRYINQLSFLSDSCMALSPNCKFPPEFLSSCSVIDLRLGLRFVTFVSLDSLPWRWGTDSVLE